MTDTPGARRIVLCADDYGLSPAISRGIRELLSQRRLSATSCMVVYPEFASDGPELRPFFDLADIGLHLTLTASRPLASLLRDGWLRRLAAREIREEVERQIAAFTSIMGRPPTYIDGHQHVHLLPGVREAVTDVAHRIGAYVRLTCEPINAAMLQRPAPIDSAYLSWVARPLARLTQRLGVRTNRGFRGVRSFRERKRFRDLFGQMIANAANGTIVMCHPGHRDGILKARDSLTDAREEEFAYFAGDDFPGDLAEAGLVLARFEEARRDDPLSTAAA